jgi:ABC-type xylose transport system permease subunit
VRLRRGELIAGASGLALILFMFVLTWYAVNGTLAPTLSLSLHQRTSFTGWQALTHLRWLLLVTALLALALAYFQATLRAPAVPVTLAALVLVLGGLTALTLVYRVLINPPGGSLDQRAGAYLGLAAAIGIAYGGFASLRHEDGPDPATSQIETVRLTGST